jgi:alpha-ribazole phosphatase
MKIYLIRHGLTLGNTYRRYIGITDEPLCDEGIEQLRTRKYPSADLIFASPLKRCIMTANIIYPETDVSQIHICENLKEMDFGMFENKSYEDLKDEPEYIKWLESDGRNPFPGGEGRYEFTTRCQKAFDECLGFIKRKFPNAQTAAFIVHGGTIMAIMEKYGTPKGEYYKWQIKNGEMIEFVL